MFYMHIKLTLKKKLYYSRQDYQLLLTYNINTIQYRELKCQDNIIINHFTAMSSFVVSLTRRCNENTNIH
jgi:hypothetical protein